MRKQRIFEINKPKANRFKEYCRDMHIDTVIENNETFKRFYCLMTDEELAKAKRFCELRCKPEPKRRRITYIIIEESC